MLSYLQSPKASSYERYLIMLTAIIMMKKSCWQLQCFIHKKKTLHIQKKIKNWHFFSRKNLDKGKFCVIF